MDHLSHEGKLHALAGNHRADEPHKKREQKIKSDEEAEETSDSGHPPVLHDTRDNILVRNDIRVQCCTLLSVRAPLRVYRSGQQSFSGFSNLSLILCHSTSCQPVDIHDDGRLSLANPHKSNRIDRGVTINTSHSRIIPIMMYKRMFNFEKNR